MALTGIGGNATVDTTGGNIGLGGILSGSGSFVKQGNGTLTLSASNSYTGNTTISAGTLAIGGVGSLGAGTLYNGNIAISSGAIFKYNSSVTDTFGGSISGNGGLMQSGNFLWLTGNNTYSGPTTITAGTLALASAGVLGGGNYAGSIAISSGAVLNYDSVAAQTFSGVISGGGGLNLLNSSSLTLTGNNTYSGNTAISAGTLQLPSGTLQSNNVVVSFGAFAQSGGVNTPGTLLDVGSGGTGSYTLSGGVLNAYTAIVGDVSGTGAFTQSGGTNSVGNLLDIGYHGPGSYTLNGGSLAASNIYMGANANASSTFTQSGGNNSVSSLYVGTAASSLYNLQNGFLSAQTINIGSGSSGTLTQSGGTNSVATALNVGNGGGGFYNLNGGLIQAASEAVGQSGSGVFTQTSGTNSVANILNVVSGSYSLSGGSLATSSTYVGTGTSSTFTQTGGTHSTANLYLGFSAIPGTYNLAGGLLSMGDLIQYGQTANFNFSGGTLQAASTFSTTVPMQLSGVSTFNTSGNSLTLGGALSGVGSLQQIGGGTLALTAGGYSGNTTIAAGKLVVGGTASLGSGGNYVGNIAIASGALLSFNSTANQSFSGAISGSGALTMSGNSQLALYGNNNYTGPTTISAGTLVIGGTGSLGSGNYAGNIAISSAAFLNYNGSAAQTFSGVLSGAGQLNQYGSGVLTLTGSSSFNGTIVASGGEILLPSGYLPSNVEYIGNSSNGTFVQSGGTHVVASTLNVGNGFEISGSYNLSGGLLQATNEVIGAGNYNIANNGTFTQTGGTNSAVNITMAQIIGGLGGVGNYNLNGGLLLVGSGGITPIDTFYSFNWGGGTLGATAPWSSSVYMSLTGSNAAVDTTGGNISLSGVLNGSGGLATLVDRKSRYTIVVKVQSKNADHVHEKIRQRMKDLDAQRRHSITFDNGTEFAHCHRLEKHLGMELYFADPGCPYQRGTNENTNGLIRQYFPKGTDFRDITHHEVRRVEKLLNNRPRACLGFRTPSEVFFEKTPPAGCD